MAINKKNDFFNPNISSRRLNKSINFETDRGWSPVLVPYTHNDLVVLQLKEWIGGEGNVPFDPTIDNYYLGTNGFVTSINNAVNIAEGYISSDYNNRIINDENLIIELSENNGVRTLLFKYNNLNGDAKIINVELFNDDNLDFDEHDITGLGMTREGIRNIILKFRQLYISNSNLLNIAGSNTVAPSQSAVINYVEGLKSKFSVPLVTLTTDKILEIENSNATINNPYYMVVSNDNRKSGNATLCTENCTGDCCDCSKYGYEEMGNREHIEGCLCTPVVNEVNAQCRVVITNLGNIHDRYEIWINTEMNSFYVVETGDTISDVVNGLIANLNTGCCGDCKEKPICTIDNITNNSFDLIAIDGLGSQPNNWTKNIIVTGTSSATLTQTVNGIDYQAPTYRGVSKHMIVYNGTDWFDLGLTLPATLDSSYLGTKYYIETVDNIIVKKYSQYIIYHTLFLHGTIMLEDDTSQIIIL